MRTIILYILVYLTFCSCNLKNTDKKINIKPVVIDSSKITQREYLSDYFIEGDSISTKVIENRPQFRPRVTRGRILDFKDTRNIT